MASFAIVNWHKRPREETPILGEPRGPKTELRMSAGGNDQVGGRSRIEIHKDCRNTALSLWRCVSACPTESVMPPLLDNKNPAAKSVFAPSALLREARRQKGLDGHKCTVSLRLGPGRRYCPPSQSDWVRRVRQTTWPCYHTELVYVHSRHTGCGHCWLCGRCAVRCTNSGRAFRQRLPTC